jgi:H+/Cl- antiporter ClcA
MLRARIEAGLAIVATVLTIVTLLWPTWIESLTGLEPDAGTGETEWWLAFVFAAIAAVLVLLARRDFKMARRQQAATEGT